MREKTLKTWSYSTNGRTNSGSLYDWY